MQLWTLWLERSCFDIDSVWSITMRRRKELYYTLNISALYCIEDVRTFFFQVLLLTDFYMTWHLKVVFIILAVFDDLWWLRRCQAETRNLLRLFTKLRVKATETIYKTICQMKMFEIVEKWYGGHFGLYAKLLRIWLFLMQVWCIFKSPIRLHVKLRPAENCLREK